MNHIWLKYKNIAKSIHLYYLCLRYVLWIYFIHDFLFEFSFLEGKSMEPTFNEFGDIGFVSKISNFNKIMNRNIKIKKGDIVSVTNPFDGSKKLCKRIVAVEGERISLNEGNYIDIPKYHIWVEGDNKENSFDSRNFGPVSIHMVEGKVIAQIWPKLKLL